MYFLLKGLRRRQVLDLTLAGIFVGLALHTYIASRFLPLVVAVPLLMHLGRWLWGGTDEAQSTVRIKSLWKVACTPCAVILFLFVALLTALPLGLYFIQNPQDFIGRGGQVSIFSSAAPVTEFLKSTGLTLQMFFWRGDCNWRHNFDCQPELHPLVAAFFLTGIIVSFTGFFRSLKGKNQETPSTNQGAEEGLNPLPVILDSKFLIPFAWLFFMSLPATLTREGLPHALRSLGMLPPVMIFAGLGAARVLEGGSRWIQKQKEKWPQHAKQLQRIKREGTLLFVALLVFIPLATYRDYFLKWAYHPQTHFAFATDLVHLGEYLNRLPRETQKYVLVNLPGAEVQGIPMPAQTVMFVTDTFRNEDRRAKNLFYALPDFVPKAERGQKIVITVLDGDDHKLISDIQKKIPGLTVSAPADFVVLQNY
jgi:hypothetical protein